MNGEKPCAGVELTPEALRAQVGGGAEPARFTAEGGLVVAVSSWGACPRCGQTCEVGVACETCRRAPVPEEEVPAPAAGPGCAGVLLAGILAWVLAFLLLAASS